MGGINHTLELGLGRWMEEGEGHDGWDQSYIRAGTGQVDGGRGGA